MNIFVSTFLSFEEVRVKFELFPTVAIITERIMGTISIFLVRYPGRATPVWAQINLLGKLKGVSAEVLPVVGVHAFAFVVYAGERTHNCFVTVDVEVLVSVQSVQKRGYELLLRVRE